MKIRISVWTLSWDTDAGTDCQVFGSQPEFFTYFRSIVEATIRDVYNPQTDAIRAALAEGEIGLAYELWQQSYKPELDTYNWDVHELDVEVPDGVAVCD